MTEPRWVESSGWRSAVSQAVADGWTFLDHLTVIDRVDSFECLLQLRRESDWSTLCLGTRVTAAEPRFECVCSVIAGADWYEREAAEQFDVTFDGHGELRPLLSHGRTGVLRKSVSLPARTQIPWPGAEGARRVRVPGVLDTWESPEEVQPS